MGRGAGDKAFSGPEASGWQTGIDDREREIAAAVQEIERAYGEQTLLYSVIERIGGETDVDRICRIAVQEIEGALGASTVLLLLLDESTGELSVKVASGAYADRVRGFRLPLDVGVTGRALRSRKPIAVRCGEAEGTGCLPFPADYLLSVPMAVRGRAVGAILVCDKKTGGEFFASEIKLASALAAYVVAVLSNAFLMAHKEAQAAALAEADRKLRQSYENLLQADKMATLGLIVGTVVHDVKNFLTAIVGNVQLLEVSDSDPYRRTSYKNILGATERIRSLLQGIKDFSRKSARTHSLLNIQKPLGEAIALIEKFLDVSGIRLVRAFRSDLPLVRGNINQLEQVFLNLFLNAAHAMEGGGNLTLSADVEGGDLVVTVADTGCGVPPEHLSQIFDVFFTTKPAGQGTGLGLAICKQIVEEHGGTIGVESEVGIGTRFTIRLPAVRDASELVCRSPFPAVETLRHPVSSL